MNDVPQKSKRTPQEIAHEILTTPLHSDTRLLSEANTVSLGKELEFIVGDDYANDTADEQYKNFGDYHFIEKARRFFDVLTKLQSSGGELTQADRETLRNVFVVLDGVIHNYEIATSNELQWSQNPKSHWVDELIDSAGQGVEEREEKLQRRARASAANYSVYSDIMDQMERKIPPLLKELAEELHIELLPRQTDRAL